MKFRNWWWDKNNPPRVKGLSISVRNNIFIRFTIKSAFGNMSVSSELRFQNILNLLTRGGLFLSHHQFLNFVPEMFYSIFPVNT